MHAPVHLLSCIARIRVWARVSASLQLTLTPFIPPPPWTLFVFARVFIYFDWPGFRLRQHTRWA